MSYIMKHVWMGAMFLLTSLLSTAQLQITEPDKSPLDISYFPHGYPVLKFQNKNTAPTPKARIIYSRPQRNGRVIFGDVVKYGEVWRMGANESTEVEFYQDVTIAGKKVAKGRYTLYCIPQQKNWTFILNKGLDTWGAFSYKQELDVLRTEVPVSNIDITVEYFTVVFDNMGTITVLWDTVKVGLPVKYTVK
jgi:hypothetical protein